MKTQRKLLLLNGAAGTGKATLIRFLAMRLGDAAPRLTKHGGVPFTVWLRAGLVALGDYVTCTPPGGDGISYTKAVSAIGDVLTAVGGDDGRPFFVAAEGQPLCRPEFIADARAAKLKVSHFDCTTHTLSRGSRVMRKHKTMDTGRADALAHRFAVALHDARVRPISITTQSPITTEAAVQLIVASLGLTLPNGPARTVDSVTRVDTFNKFTRAQELASAAETPVAAA